MIILYLKHRAQPSFHTPTGIHFQAANALHLAEKKENMWIKHLLRQRVTQSFYKLVTYSLADTLDRKERKDDPFFTTLFPITQALPILPTIYPIPCNSSFVPPPPTSPTNTSAPLYPTQIPQPTPPLTPPSLKFPPPQLSTPHITPSLHTPPSPPNPSIICAS
jgi:hypothetical protein